MRLLLDTCVWFNFLDSDKTIEVLKDIKSLLDENKIELIVPEQTVIELKRNSDKVLNSRKASLKTFRNHAGKLKKVLDDGQGKILDDVLKLVDAAIPKFELETDETFALVQEVINHRQSKHISTTDNDKIRATERGLLKKAPFNKGAKNSMGDAVILEGAFRLQREEPTDPFYFITLNTEDFSDSTDKKLPHKDIQDELKELNIKYSILPGDIIEEIARIPVSEEAKHGFYYRERENYIPLLDNTIPDACYECGNDLIDVGYRVMRGCAGQMFICKKCGTIHQILDPDY